MEGVKRYTKKYGFKAPDVGKLRELASSVQDPSNFRKSYGKLLPILNTHVDEGLLKTLVQFYDPLKCAFFVQAGDFLGFVVHKKGIEINQNKTKAIMET